MAALRHLVLAILGAMGMLSVSPAFAFADSCPMEVSAAHSMPMHRHGQPAAPMNHDQQVCAACVAVLPPPPSIGSHVLPPVVLFTGKLQPLSGIDLALDPPPRRIG